MLRLSSFALLACSAPLLAASPATSEVAMAQGRAALAHLPLRFEANRGQMAGPIRFAARSGASGLFLTDQGATVMLNARTRIDLRLLHSLPAAIEPLEPTTTRTDYFVGARRNWHSGVPSYAKVRYRRVYPGVDVVYYGNGSQLEYDFVVAPGGDPSAIQMEFAGASKLALTANGDLEVQAGGSRLIQHRPVLYQQDAGTGDRRPVEGRYRLLGANRVALHVGGYDRGRELVIDPVLTYATYFGGSGSDRITAAKMGPNGRLYLAGWTDSGQQPFVDGAYNSEQAGLIDIFIAIVDTTDPGYRILYFSYLGGTNNDEPLALDVDAAGVMYLTGTTTSTDFPVVNATQSSGAASSVDAFVAKLDPSVYGKDALQFSTYLGGTTNDDSGTGISVDASGMIYVIGTTKADDFPVTSSAYLAVKWGPQDAFLVKIDPVAPAVLYASFFGGEDLDEGRGIAVAEDGRAYFGVSTLSQTPPWTGTAYNPNPSGAQDMIIGVLDASKEGDASIPYATLFGGSGNDEIRGFSLSRGGALLLTGYTLSTDFPLTPDAMQTSNNGHGDAFVTVFDVRRPYAGGLIYSTYLGGKGGDVGYGIADDADGNIFVTGYTLSPDFPTSASGVPQANYPGGTDIFLTKFKPGVAGSGAILYSTYIGATSQYVPSNVVVGQDGTAYVMGYAGIGLPTSDISTQGGFAGGQSDGFLVVVAPDQATASPDTAGARLHHRTALESKREAGTLRGTGTVSR